ncbi:MAG: hypothetical protein AB7F35_13595 [Acetobacteraceae bacterium]
MRPSRYLLAMAAATVLSFAAVWAWVACMPMAYLDPEYPFWRAKQDLLRGCDLGEVLVLGDSRAAAGIIPSQMPVRTTNLAVGGGKPVEAYAILQRAMNCPRPPHLVVLSFDATHFMRPDLFWERTVRYGLLDRSDLRDLARVSEETGDWSVFNARRSDGLPPGLRIALYALRVPPLYFANLLKGGVFLRWWANHERYEAGLDARGQHHFGTEPGSDGVALDAGLGSFRPAPVLDRYFGRILALLADRGIPAVFVALPVNEATARAVPASLAADVHAYLVRYAARFPGFRVIGDVLPAWPNRWFGDGFSHLNPDGSRRFSAWLGACLSQRDGADACAPATADAPYATRFIHAPAAATASRAF